MRSTATRTGTRLLSVRAVVEEYGIPRGTLVKLLESGAIRRVKLPRIRRTWLDRESVERLLADGASS
jgi:hypothetical protein